MVFLTQILVEIFVANSKFKLLMPEYFGMLFLLKYQCKIEEIQKRQCVSRGWERDFEISTGLFLEITGASITPSST